MLVHSDCKCSDSPTLPGNVEVITRVPVRVTVAVETVVDPFSVIVVGTAVTVGAVTVNTVVDPGRVMVETAVVVVG